MFLNLWLNKMLFSWRWFVNVALAILPWVFWAFLRDRKRTHSLLFSAFLLALITSCLDMLGMTLGIWSYYSKPEPLISPYLKWDITLLPVTAMFFYQYRPEVHSSVKSVIFAGLGSFVVQPVFEFLRFVNHKHWEDFYSFPILFALYLIGWYAFRYREKKESKL